MHLQYQEAMGMSYTSYDEDKFFMYNLVFIHINDDIV